MTGDILTFEVFQWSLAKHLKFAEILILCLFSLLPFAGVESPAPHFEEKAWRQYHLYFSELFHML